MCVVLVDPADIKGSCERQKDVWEELRAEVVGTSGSEENWTRWKGHASQPAWTSLDGVLEAGGRSLWASVLTWRPRLC